MKRKFLQKVQVRLERGCRKLVILENECNLTGSVQAIYMQNLAEEEVKLGTEQRLVKIHSLYVNKEAWLTAELKRDEKREVFKENDGVEKNPFIPFKNQIIQQRKVKESLFERVYRQMRCNQDIFKELFSLSIASKSLWENRYHGIEDIYRSRSCYREIQSKNIEPGSESKSEGSTV